MTDPARSTAAPVPAASPRLPIWAFLAYTLLFAIAFEVAVRVEDLVRFGTPLASPFRSQTDLIVRDALGVHGRPDARFEKWQMNNVGARGPDIVLDKPAGVIRVLVVGASESFGLYETRDREYPRVLEARLNELIGCADASAMRFEVVNAAVPGMSLPTATQDLRLRLASLRPDIVVVYPTPMQYLEEKPPMPAKPDPDWADPMRSPMAPVWPRGLSRLRSSFKSLVPEQVLDVGRRVIVQQARTDAPLFAEVPLDRLELFTRDVSAVIQEIQAIGAEPVVLAHLNAFAPNAPRDPLMLRAWERFYPQATGDVIVSFDSIARPATAQAAAAAGALFIDASPAIEPIRAEAFADYSHFTDSGAFTLGDTIARALLSAKDRPRGCRVVGS